MLHTLARNWRALALRGLVAVLFGLLTFFVPAITLVTLVFLFGVYALLDGLFNVIAFIRVPAHHWALLLEGVIGIAAGILTFAWPAITAIVLLYLIAFWAIFTGVLEIIAGIRLRKVAPNEWFLLVAGALSLLFGILILLAPGLGALAIVLWISAYACLFGSLFSLWRSGSGGTGRSWCNQLRPECERVTLKAELKSATKRILADRYK